MRLPGERATRADCDVRAHRPAAGGCHHPGTALTVPQLRATRRLGRPGPRHRPRLRRRDQLREPVLPVPLPPPAEDLRPGLALRHAPRRPPAGDPTVRRHEDQPTTGATTTRRATTVRTRRRPTVLA